MPDFEKLQKEFDILLEKLTKEDWDNWRSNLEKRSEDKKQEMLMQANYLTAMEEAKFNFQHKLIEEGFSLIESKTSKRKKLSMPFGQQWNIEYEWQINKNLRNSINSKETIVIINFLSPELIISEGQFF